MYKPTFAPVVVQQAEKCPLCGRTDIRVIRDFKGSKEVYLEDHFPADDSEEFCSEELCPGSGHQVQP